ncbi:TfoX/Sxy family protein [Kitasatospora sp. NPDC006697]|uniref:TfoX/Sxy family protein n=1 Tax=Kitasatospora sp. NPDC006697 TaxID=3364020 RepID=UPI0036792B57
MTVNEVLARRIRDELGELPGLSEKRMFGGLAFLLNGNMAVGVHGDELIVRLDPGHTDAALARPGARLFEMGGRSMRGWLLVDRAALAAPGALADWVAEGVEFAESLPPK